MKPLTVIKLIHTAIWLFYNGVIFYLLYAVIINKIDKWVWFCVSAVLAEGMILLFFKWLCPLTILARKYSRSAKSNFDIYLPEWLARHNKLVYTTIFGLAVILLAFRLLQKQL